HDGLRRGNDSDEGGELCHAPRLHALPHTSRSEEHTSELQSQSNLVCRLLLEKKNLKKPGQDKGGETQTIPGDSATHLLSLFRYPFPPLLFRVLGTLRLLRISIDFIACVLLFC